MQLTLCSIPGCDRPVRHRGWCRPHYERFLRTDNPGEEIIPLRYEVQVCLVEGCDRPVHCKGYCRPHYQRVSRNGTPGDAAIKQVGVMTGCLVEGCEREHHCQGYCRAHYNRIRKTGEAGCAEIKPWGRAKWTVEGDEAACIACGETKPATEFYGRVQPCKECTKAERQRWRNANAALIRSRQRGYHLRHYFDIGPDDYDALLAGQDGGCAICGAVPVKERSFPVDHDHDTGVIRGVLCHLCNRGLGFLDEDAGRMTSAIAYLAGSTGGRS